jgi:hypothetical protein
MAEAEGTPAPETTSGPQTSTATESTSQQTTHSGSETTETFFDPESIKGKPELELAYKQMQGEFTRRTTELKKHEQKIKMYDAFAANPAQAIQEVAAQMGYKLTKAEAQAIANEQGKSEFAPQSWEDVISKAKSEAKQELLAELSPFINQVKEARQGQVEKTLDEKCPDWRVYEPKMMEMLQKHPTLVNDPEELYRVSVPPEVWTARATQAALRKLQDKVSASELSGGSTTTQPASDKPKGKMSFNESVEYAKRQLAAQGKRPPN